jgi:hypothetical protein
MVTQGHSRPPRAFQAPKGTGPHLAGYGEGRHHECSRKENGAATDVDGNLRQTPATQCDTRGRGVSRCTDSSPSANANPKSYAQRPALHTRLAKKSTKTHCTAECCRSDGQLERSPAPAANDRHFVVCGVGGGGVGGFMGARGLRI